MSKSLKAEFASEAELCSTFIKQLPTGWTAYPETEGFDILLVRNADGAQIGVEAKLTLNAKVLLQASEADHGYAQTSPGPDFRAALVPYGRAPFEMVSIASRLGITVIEMKTKAVYLSDRYNRKKFNPDLPVPGEYEWRQFWHDRCPWQRCRLPEYIPDVSAGASAPMKLSEWKIKAIKICIILERTGYLTRKDFAEIKIDHRRFLDMEWMKHSDERGKYVAGRYPLDLRRQHPKVYPQIEADFDKWFPKDRDSSPIIQGQEVLL